jgi:hypothetical protein
MSSLQKATFFRDFKPLKNGKTQMKVKGYTKDVVQSVASDWCKQHQGSKTQVQKSEGFWKVTCKGFL